MRFGAQDEIVDGNQVREAFAGAGACGHNVRLAAAGDLDRFLLAAIEAQGRAVTLAEEPGGVRENDAPTSKLVQGGTGLVGRVELQDAVRPEDTRVEFLAHVAVDPRVSDADEALDVASIVGNDLVTQGKNVHDSLVPLSAWFLTWFLCGAPDLSTSHRPVMLPAAAAPESSGR